MKKLLLSVVIASVLSTNAMAENPSFNYFDFGYSRWQIGNSIVKPDGFELKASKAINDQFYIAGDYTRISEDAHVGLATLGLGYKYNFSESATLFTEVDYANLNPEYGNSENGYELTAGIRGMLTSNFELKGAVEYLNIDDNDTTSFVAGAVYSFNENIAAYLDYKTESDLDRLSLGFRIYY